jgi:hypothetical protein
VCIDLGRRFAPMPTAPPTRRSVPFAHFQPPFQPVRMPSPLRKREASRIIARDDAYSLRHIDTGKCGAPSALAIVAAPLKATHSGLGTAPTVDTSVLRTGRSASSRHL